MKTIDVSGAVPVNRKHNSFDHGGHWYISAQNLNGTFVTQIEVQLRCPCHIR